MSRPEGRVHSELDTVVSPQKKRVEGRGRLLAPILLGTALAILGGRNSTDAQGVDKDIVESKLTPELSNIPQKIGDTDIFYPAVDPKTGVPLANQDWIDKIARSSHMMNLSDQDNTEQFADPRLLEQVELSYDQLKIIDEIQQYTGMYISIPKDPSKIPGSAGKWGVKENVPLTIHQLENLLAGFQRLPPSYLDRKYVGGSCAILPDVMFFVSGPQLGNGGVNSNWSHETRCPFIASVMTQSGVDPDLPLIYPAISRPYLARHGEILVYEMGHEGPGHMINRTGNEVPDSQMTRYKKDVGWIDGKLPPDRSAEDIPGRKSPSEAFADALGFLIARPKAFMTYVDLHPYTSRHIVLESIRTGGNYKDWSVLYDDGEIQIAVERIISTIEQENNNPIVSPTATPSSNIFTVYLPVTYTGEKDFGPTPEPEERFGRGSNLSDARRFNPNYENRRINRKGR